MHRRDVVVLDARRFEEYQTMNIPGGVSVPGAELALRVRALAPDPATRIVVNCAGRTRSIIGAQSLVNAGHPNPVARCAMARSAGRSRAWTLEHGSASLRSQSGRGEDLDARGRLARARRARACAARRSRSGALGERRVRTDYRFDVRTPGEYEPAHAPGFLSAPGRPARAGDRDVRAGARRPHRAGRRRRRYART